MDFSSAFQILNEGGRLKPNFYWVEKIIGQHGPGKVPSVAVLVFSVCCGLIFALLQWGGPGVYTPTWWAVLLLALFIFVAMAGQ